MKVWLVITEAPCETRTVEGVRKNRGGAEKMAKALNQQRWRQPGTRDIVSVVEEWRVE